VATTRIKLFLFASHFIHDLPHFRQQLFILGYFGALGRLHVVETLYCNAASIGISKKEGLPVRMTAIMEHALTFILARL